jgi:hypothetical protein
MKYLLLLESFVRREELNKNPSLKYIHDKVSVQLPDNPKTEEVSLWMAKSILLHIREVIRKQMDREYERGDNTNFVNNKEKFNMLRGRSESVDRTFIDDEMDALSNMIKTIIDYIYSPVRTLEWKLPLKLSLKQAYELSTKWHDQLKATGTIEDESGKVMMTFDDGFYFIDLNTDTSTDEGRAMGHCGYTSAETLVSLRDSKKNPHVTIAMDRNGVIKQIKGKQNTKPVENYHPYVVRFLTEYATGLQWEYDPEHDLRPKDLTEEELTYIHENGKLNNDREFIGSCFLKGIFKEEFDIKTIYKELERDKDGKVYIEATPTEMMRLFKDCNHEICMAYESIEKILIGEDSFELFPGYVDMDSFFTYDWVDVKPETKQLIVEIFEEEDDITAVFDPEKNDIFIYGVPLEDFEEFSDTNTYDILLEVLETENSLSTEALALSTIMKTISKVYSYNSSKNILYVSKDMIMNALGRSEYRDSSFMWDYSRYLEDTDGLIEVSVPYYGFNGDFDPELFHDLISDR